MKALVNAPRQAPRVAMMDVPEPEPRDDELLLSVAASSLNRGELALMRSRPQGWRPGQDVAGVVERAARNGTGPAAGTRVLALIDNAGWAERVAVPATRAAVVPDDVTFAQAAALPMIGLTALNLLRRCGSVLGRSLAVTGASGGVGHMVVQLGRLAGVRVTAIAEAAHADWLVALGAAEVLPTLDDLQGRHDFILESIGGSSLEAAIPHVKPNGLIVSFGNSSASKAAFDLLSFVGSENARIESFLSYKAFDHARTGTDLAYLLGLIVEGSLDMRSTVHDWRDLEVAAKSLEQRSVRGKIVLAIAG